MAGTEPIPLDANVADEPEKGGESISLRLFRSEGHACSYLPEVGFRRSEIYSRSIQAHSPKDVIQIPELSGTADKIESPNHCLWKDSLR